MKTYAELKETLTVAGRRKLSRKAKQQKSKLKIARKRHKKRVAPMERILKRAQRRARTRVADHILRGRDKRGLSAAAKANVEKRVDARKAVVKTHMRREIQKARKADREK